MAEAFGPGGRGRGLMTRAESRVASRRSGDTGKRTEYLAFVLAGDTYAIQIAFIAEILKPPPLTTVPRAPKEVIGVMSVRGRLVTVVDLRRRFRLAEQPSDRKTRILLVEAGDEHIGLLVDEVLQVYRLSESEIEPAQVLGGDQPAHIAGIGRPEGALLILVDLKPILNR
ncbi:MAG: chemotaxis protein CheW [Polyangiaceae bacterium]|jgi:purine-binding chemotaxis protein CheW